MKFLIDFSAYSRRMYSFLEDLGYEVESVTAYDATLPDEAILDYAFRENFILITLDKDFGELVYYHRLPHPCIIRFTQMTASENVEAMARLLDAYSDALEEPSIIVVSPRTVRIRRPPQ